MNLHKKIAALIFPVLFIGTISAQTGTFTASFTSENTLVKPVSLSFTKSTFKFDNAHGYWFVNPHNNYKHFNVQPEQGYGDRKEELNGIGFITFTTTENDFDTYELNDSISMQLQKGKNIIKAPKYDPKKGDKNKPLHIHINSITPTEISFTLSGSAALSYTEGYAEPTIGTISGTGHFYREPQYIKTDVLPGCNCDATIYPVLYDPENNLRSTSACENALRNKVFNAMQKTFAPVIANVGFHGRQGVPGDIIITMLPGHTDIDVPAGDPDYCNTQGQQHATGFAAEKKYYNNEDGYGIRMIKLPTDEQSGQGNNNAAGQDFIKNIAAIAAKSDSLMKLYMAKKISMEEYQKQANALSASANTPTQQKSNEAFEIAKVETNLSIQVFLNPDNAEMWLMKVSDKNKTVIEHKIKGSAFELFSPMIKDNDGSWLVNKKFLYFGKFTPPVNGKSGGGFDAKVTNAIYPANGNKLNIYNIIIRLEGGADLIEKAIANIDFDALQSLITKQ